MMFDDPPGGGGKTARRVRRLLAQLQQVSPSACQAASASASASAEEEVPLWKEYVEDAVKRAHALGNRGPIRFDADGKVAQEIQDAYWEHGFYVFENVMRPEEVTEMNADFDAFMDNAPTDRKSKVDKHGRPVKMPSEYSFDTPGTVSNLSHPLKLFPSCLRLYGHPDVLRVVEAFNGPDFTPFAERMYHKEAGVGSPTAWHQDGYYNWDESGIQPPEKLVCHGFTMHAAWSNCAVENCMWVVPKSHLRRGVLFEDGTTHSGVPNPHSKKEGPLELALNRVKNNGDPMLGDTIVRATMPKKIDLSGNIDRLPGAVPMLMKPGDVGVHNRSCLHGAFSSKHTKAPQRRLTMIFGFQQRRHVLNRVHRDAIPFKYRDEMLKHHKGIDKAHVVMDEEYLHKSCRMVQVAIDARRQKFPDETPYVYQPMIGHEEENRYNEKTIKEVVEHEGRYAITN